MKRIGVIMHGITGRMGYNQHLVRSVLAIRDQGGVVLKSGEKVMLDPILVGRNGAKIEEIAKKHNVARWTTDIDAALANPDDTLFFDSRHDADAWQPARKSHQGGQERLLRKADFRQRGRGAGNCQTGRKRRRSNTAWCRTSCSCPAFASWRCCVTAAFSARSSRCAASSAIGFSKAIGSRLQRPSWNYRLKDGGGIILDMLCHWRYVLDNLFGPVKSVSCLGATHIPERFDEQGHAYAADADDAAYATFELEGGAIAHINSSWAVRVRRDDLVTFQVDGTHGSAVAGLTKCWTQHRTNTPKPVWNPDQPQTIDFYKTWQEVPDNVTYDNGFKAQWEMFVRHLVDNDPWPYGLMEGVKGVQLAELGLRSWKERRWLDVPALS